MRTRWLSIVALLLSVFGVLMGNGVMTTLVPVRAAIEGFAKDPGALLAALAAEQAAKPGQGHGGKMGFLG